MEIRKAAASDIPELAVLFNAYRVFYKKTSDLKGAEHFLTDRLANNESVVFASFSGTTMTGFTQLYPLFSSTRMKRLWLLNDLYVDEKFRGQGFSIALIDRVKKFCHETNACGFILETAKTNNVGNRLYPKMEMSVDKDHNFYSWDI